MFARKRVLAFLIVVLLASGFSMLFVWPEADEVQSIVHYENSILSFNNEEVGSCSPCLLAWWAPRSDSC